jgi:chemotaxis-related protein WspD
MTPKSTSVESLPMVGDCWNRIGVRGDRSCPELLKVVHCHNCPVFANAGRQFLDAPTPPGYLEEWTSRVAQISDEEATNRISILVFRIGEEWLGLPVSAIVEVTPPRPIHKVPHRGGFLAGLVNIRGELQICIRLAQVLGLSTNEPNPNAESTRFLIVEYEGDRWASPVDAVDRVWRIPENAFTQPPPTVRRAQTKLTLSVFPAKNRWVGYLDLKRLFHALRAKTG